MEDLLSKYFESVIGLEFGSLLEIIPRDRELVNGPYLIDGAVEVEHGLCLSIVGAKPLTALWKSSGVDGGLEIIIGNPNPELFTTRKLAIEPVLGQVVDVVAASEVDGGVHQLVVQGRNGRFDILLGEVDETAGLVKAAPQAVTLVWKSEVIAVDTFIAGALLLR
ncbi:hypothetical protein GOEFS_039_00330 [Gordonia effusa NBRC 100432]|uniref:Uncharacterized protein n=1 Tax=Gordonia effusa NBRC 100432 TaxID=1077974 RepID=H0QY98_9ACTN|nr:hypothetical protein [Gordonia effusa]GAB17799.1 hypothetical protein GOEFS_039_00330 [Gordonia effusa NBRC 100432]